MAKLSQALVGRRVRLIKMLDDRLNETVQPGTQGTVVSVIEETDTVVVQWDGHPQDHPALHWDLGDRWAVLPK